MKDILFKLLGDRYTILARRYRELQTYAYSALHPYHYDAFRYAGTFLEKKCTLYSSKELNRPINRIIYIFWTGNNQITPNRLAGIKSLEAVTGVEVKLITPNNLIEYIKSDDPLPEAYQYLSYVHRADYLRSYFMYYYGGGYSDIKQATSSWVNAFNRLDNSDAFAIGYPEVGFWGVANRGIVNKKLKNDLFYYWRILIGNGAYICRPYTPFVAEWYSETKRRVVLYTEKLRKNPAQDPFGRIGGYPIPWEKILGEVFHPVCLKYHDKILQDKALLPVFQNYR